MTNPQSNTLDYYNGDDNSSGSSSDDSSGGSSSDEDSDEDDDNDEDNGRPDVFMFSSNASVHSFKLNKVLVCGCTHVDYWTYFFHNR